MIKKKQTQVTESSGLLFRLCLQFMSPWFGYLELKPQFPHISTHFIRIIREFINTYKSIETGT